MLDAGFNHPVDGRFRRGAAFQRGIARGLLHRAIHHRAQVDRLAEIEHAHQQDHKGRRDDGELDDGRATRVAAQTVESARQHQSTSLRSAISSAILPNASLSAPELFAV